MHLDLSSSLDYDEEHCGLSKLLRPWWDNDALDRLRDPLQVFQAESQMPESIIEGLL
jgi:hypothetical protein